MEPKVTTPKLGQRRTRIAIAVAISAVAAIVGIPFIQAVLRAEAVQAKIEGERPAMRRLRLGTVTSSRWFISQQSDGARVSVNELFGFDASDSKDGWPDCWITRFDWLGAEKRPGVAIRCFGEHGVWSAAGVVTRGNSDPPEIVALFVVSEQLHELTLFRDSTGWFAETPDRRDCDSVELPDWILAALHS